MIYAGKLFKILFDLVSSTQYYTNGKKKKQQNKDIIDEESTDGIDADLENQIFHKIQAKFFIQAEIELKRLNSLFQMGLSREITVQVEKDL